jgi:uncharacterized protein
LHFTDTCKKLNMNILISGSTGLVGQKLKEALIRSGHMVTGIGRADFSGPEDALNTKVGQADVVINLSGAPIVARWTESYKKEIMDSRILTTRRLVKAIKNVPAKPRLLISTSAVGIYPEGGEFSESNARYGEDFLAEVCKAWEAEALKASPETKVAVFRLGVVLDRKGGALQKMLPAFRLGLGGPIAGGKQGFSWIHIDDLINAYLFVIEKQLDGVFNLSAPQATDNAGYTRALGKVLGRPVFFPIPAFGLRLLYGEGATALTSGQKALPERLLQEGFVFKFPEIEAALADLVGIN